MSGIYNGYNPIYESLRKEIFEEENKSEKNDSPDFSDLLRTIYDTFTNLLINGADDDIKIPENFKKYFSDNILKATTIDTIKNDILNKIDSLSQNDKEQSSSYSQLKQYISTLFDKLTSMVGDSPDTFKKIINSISSYVDGTASTLETRKATLLQNNESFVTKYIAEQTDGNTAVEPKKAWERLAKKVLDVATSFAGEISSAMSDKTLSGNSDIQKFSDFSIQALRDAKNLQIAAGRPFLGPIETVSGEMRGKDYNIKVINLINEITRQRNQFYVIKYRLTEIPAPPTTAIICPPGFKYDDQAKVCVPIKTQQPTKADKKNSDNNVNKKKSTESCNFPISITVNSCDNVIELQKKLVSLGSCVSDLINKHGGTDGKYGKVTAKISNIAYSYISKSDSFNESGDLTKEMYDSIIGYTIPAKESIDLSKIIGNKIFEKEYEASNPVISFNTFKKILNEADTDATTKKSIDDFICQKYNGKKDTGSPAAKPDDKKSSSKWQGLKPAPNGIYFISYDESTGSAILQSTEVAVGVTAVVLTAGTLIAGLAPASAAGTALISAGGGSIGVLSPGAGLVLSNMTAGAVASGSVAIGSGALAGLGNAWWNTRTNVGISTIGGFISRAGMMKINRGMSDTTDGWVSNQDLTAIMATLCLLKGAWTTNKDRTKALSAWSEFKKMYSQTNEIDIKSEINKIGTKTVKDCKGFPDFDSNDLSEGETINADDALTMIKEAIDKLDANDDKLLENIKDLTADDIEKIYQGAKLSKKKESDNEEDENNKIKKEGSVSGAKP